MQFNNFLDFWKGTNFVLNSLILAAKFQIHNLPKNPFQNCLTLSEALENAVSKHVWPKTKASYHHDQKDCSREGWPLWDEPSRANPWGGEASEALKVVIIIIIISVITIIIIIIIIITIIIIIIITRRGGKWGPQAQGAYFPLSLFSYSPFNGCVHWQTKPPSFCIWCQCWPAADWPLEVLEQPHHHPWQSPPRVFSPPCRWPESS